MLEGFFDSADYREAFKDQDLRQAWTQDMHKGLKFVYADAKNVSFHPFFVSLTNSYLRRSA
jgi:hypothetical protein